MDQEGEVHSDAKRLAARFDTLFSEGGLANIKFFVRDSRACTLADVKDEILKIQDTIAAGDVQLVESIDAGVATRRFDDPF